MDLNKSVASELNPGVSSNGFCVATKRFASTAHSLRPILSGEFEDIQVPINSDS